MRAENVLIWPGSRRSKDRSVWRGMAAGALGGLAGTLVMTQFQNAWNALSSEDDSSAPKESQDAGDPSTVKVAQHLSRTLTGREIPESRKNLAGQAVHYGFGTMMGAAYGIAAEQDPRATAGAGLAFGTAVWLVADEIGVPAAGLSDLPHKVPVKVHAYALASHLVYGLATELARRAVRRVL